MMHDGPHREDWGKVSFGGTGDAFAMVVQVAPLAMSQAKGAKFASSELEK